MYPGTGLIPILIYATGSGSIEPDNSILTENSISILTESSQMLVTET